MTLLGELPRRSAAAFGERTAVVDGELTVSYAELDRRVRATAAALHARGVAPGDRVALLLPTGLAIVECYLALASLGAVAVPVGTRLSPREAAFILDHAGARLVIHDPALAARLAETALERIALAHGERLGPEAATPPRPAIDPTDDVAIFYTSGTTGDPKGVRLTHRNVMHCVTVSAEAFGLTEEDRSLCHLPLSHTTMHFLPLPTLLRGGTLVLRDGFDAAEVLDLLAAHRITVYVGVTSTMALLVKHGASGDLRGVRKILTGGSPVPAALMGELRTLAPNATVVNCYGMTETASSITRMDPDAMPAKPGSAGLPYRGIEVRIAGAGEIGEIEVRSPSLMAGYWVNDRATREAIVDGWLRTGDMGRLDADGYLWIVGRRKHALKRGGETIFPAEIEAALAEHPGIREAAVVARRDDVMGERVVAVVAPLPGAGVTEDAVVAHCAERLADFKVPEYVALVGPALPKTSVGKVDLAALERMVADGAVPVADRRRGSVRGQPTNRLVN